jgi:hypothetical protein
LGPLLSQSCAKCGQKVVAENKSGEWLPKNHYSSRSGKLLRGYNSGKRGGYKR